MPGIVNDEGVVSPVITDRTDLKDRYNHTMMAINERERLTLRGGDFVSSATAALPTER